MSLDIDLQDNPEPGRQQPPERLNAVLSILLAIVLFVAAVVVLLVGRQRMQQAALLKASPTVVTRTIPSPVLTLTPLVQATRATSLPTAVAPPVPTAAPTQTRALPQPTASAEQAKPAASPTAIATARTAAPTATTAPVAATPETAASGKASSWFFGEGASVSPFRTYYSIYNPGSLAAKVTVSLYPETGQTVQRSITVAPGTQTDVLANGILPNAAFGAGISSDQPVYVERLTIGDRDGTTSSGMTPAKAWYFPEAQTGDDFTTWLLVLNPNTSPAALTVTYYPVTGSPVVKTYTAPPTARLTIAAQKDVASAVMGIVLESSQPVVAEHAIYFDNQKAAYGGPGLTALSKNWYVGSGNTQPGFTARLALFNPNKEPAIIKVTLIGSNQKPVSDLYSLEPQGKDDIVLNDRADEQSVAAIVESDQPVAAQLVTYYMSGGENGPVAACSAPAVPALAKQWYVPDASANNEYDSYVMLFNPGTASAAVTVGFVAQGSEPVNKQYNIPASGRMTLRVSDEVKGKTVVAASVNSTQPIAVERVTMFRTTVGATSSAGIPGQ